MLSLTGALLLVACGGSGTEPSAPPAALAVVTQPSGGASGSALGTQPVIRVLDATGALARDAATVVTASIQSGTGTVSGTTTATAVGGIATFTDLRIVGAGAHSLRFTSGTLTPAVSGAFTIIGPPASVTFPVGRVIINVGAAALLTLPVRDAAGTLLIGAPLTFTSRNPAIATVDAAGGITGIARGQTVIVAAATGSPAVADSLLAVVATPGAPVLYTSIPGFTVTPGATIAASIYLDMRGSTKRLASGQVEVRFTPAQLTYATLFSLTFAPEVNASGAGAGVLRFSFADPNGVAGQPIEIARVAFTAASTVGTAGVLDLKALELTASDYTDLLPGLLPVSQPLVVR